MSGGLRRIWSFLFWQNNCMLGMGSGQPNRLESLRIALRKAGDEVKGAALASDAFFPFGKYSFFFKSPYFINKFERRWEETNISVPGISCEMSFSLHRCERIDWYKETTMMGDHRTLVPYRLIGIRIQPESTATHFWLEYSCEKTGVPENRLGMIVTSWTEIRTW